MDPDWIVRPMEDGVRPGGQEERGYKFFNALWRNPTRPEGIVLYPDYLARGAFMAMMELGVRVPQDLKLVVHRNKRYPLLCPVHALFVESDEEEVADALLRQIKRQLSGEPTKLELVGFRLCKACSS